MSHLTSSSECHQSNRPWLEPAVSNLHAIPLDHFSLLFKYLLLNLTAYIRKSSGSATACPSPFLTSLLHIS